MPATPKTFVGFGFGAIQAGLFLYEAFRSGNFGRLVVAEVVPDIVGAVRLAHGSYRVNIATPRGIQVQEVSGVEILNPTVPADARALADALAEASEIATALPSVEFYRRGKPSVAGLIAGALRRKAVEDNLARCVIYTAENHNHAAEILQAQCENKLDETARSDTGRSRQFLNTVIGKMSGVVTDPSQFAAEGLTCLTDDLSRAFLVEEFNRILITQISLPDFKRGIEVFSEKSDLLPFEEAKLYGHNAVHALMGYLAQAKGYRFMSEAANDGALMALARGAFLEESGPALIARHKGIDPLFAPAGFQAYAEDLLVRMTNPYLRDGIERVTRDTPRKLAWDDRLIGTMRLALDAGITPRRFALGAAAALEALTLPPVGADVRRLTNTKAEIRASSRRLLQSDNGTSPAPSPQLQELWPGADQPLGRKSQLIQLITEAQLKLKTKKSNHGNF